MISYHHISTERVEVMRRLIWAIVVITVVLVTGCSAEDPSLVFGGRRYHQVDEDGGVSSYESADGQDTMTIEKMDGEWDFAVEVNDERYLLSGDSGTFSVRFPDGRVLRRSRSGTTSTGSTEPGTPTTFDDWDTVDDLGVLVFGSPQTRGGERSYGMAIVGIILIISGLVSVLNPALAFFLEIGWRMDNAKPSEAYLVFSRIFGIVLIIIGASLVLR